MRSCGVDLSPLQAAHEVRPAWRTETAPGPEVLAMSKKQEAEVEARLKEFWDDHKDFDSAWARDILVELDAMLPFVFKEVPDLEQLYLKSGVRIPDDVAWDDAAELLPAAVLSPLPIFKYALALSAYADYGLILQFPKEDGILEVDIWEFINRVPRWAIQPAWAEGVRGVNKYRGIIAAQARRKLDQHESVTPDELAALARVRRKSIMNLAAPGKEGVVLQKSKVVPEGEDDQITSESGWQITSESAMRWLLSRPDFRRSIWQQQKNLDFSLLPKQATPSFVEPLFVPVTADGSWFSPQERRDGHYQVGNGDDEKQFDDYWTALDFLARAASPRWRYADTTGRWRIKMGTGWERKAREKVEKLLAEQMESKKINHTRKA
jgi:hypothetical protein